jgi:orotidine-5'-phosphate decarboxylase
VNENPIIVALDLPRGQALDVAESLRGRVSWLKVGMTLYYAEGPKIVETLHEMGFSVFVDLKLYDIPHQASGAAAAIARLGAGMLTVHASGGAAMMVAAVKSARAAAAEEGLAPPAVLAVTVLTSADDATLRAVGVDRGAAAQVALLGALARDAGVDGVVCSPHEAQAMRLLFGPQGYVVTPGVRPARAAIGDQSRVATPTAAVAAGASHLVIGRPVTAATDPAAALDLIVAELNGAAS